VALRPRLATGLPLTQRASQVSMPPIYLCGNRRSLIHLPATACSWIEGLFTDLPRSMEFSEVRTALVQHLFLPDGEVKRKNT
jgi:hypothetical protein